MADTPDAGMLLQQLLGSLPAALQPTHAAAVNVTACHDAFAACAATVRSSDKDTDSGSHPGTLALRRAAALLATARCTATAVVVYFFHLVF